MSYIEREKAFDAVFGQFCASSDETEAALNAAIDEIKAIPAADVRPVTRGRWLDKWYEDDELVGGGYTVPQCSACNGESGWKSPYCPNCGARMEES